MRPGQVLAPLRAAYGDMTDWWPVDRAYHAANGTDARFEICLGAILTQNTSWANVERALANLKVRRLLEPGAIVAARRATLESALRPAGTFRQKADYVRAFSRACAEHPGGLDGLLRLSTPDLRARLLGVRGVGPETADAILAYAAHRPVFVVDAYLRRLTQRLGLGPEGEPYEDLQRRWSDALPTSAQTHQEAHALVVEHAKRVCTSRRPRCGDCALNRLCPWPRA